MAVPVSSEPSCSPNYELALLNLQDGSIKPIASGLPPISSSNERPVVGEVPKCPPGTTSGTIGEYYGRISFSQAYAWWQAPISR